MKLTVYKFWCEWDIGINDELWFDQEDMLEDISKALKEVDIEESIEQLEDDGLIGFQWQRVR